MTARLALVLLAGWLCSGHAALGQSLADPMRPPSVTGGSGDAGEAEPEGKQLQSVLIARNRRLAIINGETVRPGDRLGDAVVARISETEVVLRYPDRSETLKLMGAVVRTPVRSRPASTAGSGSTK